jgi:hypothetical protein
MFRNLVMGAAALLAVSAPAFAAGPYVPAPHRAAPATWVVLQETSNGDCFVTDRKAGAYEAQVSPWFASQAQAETAMNNSAACDEAWTSQKEG